MSLFLCIIISIFVVAGLRKNTIHPWQIATGFFLEDIRKAFE